MAAAKLMARERFIAGESCINEIGMDLEALRGGSITAFWVATIERDSLELRNEIAALQVYLPALRFVNSGADLLLLILLFLPRVR